MKVKEIISKEPVPLFLGGLIGAGVALLLAPRSGKETVDLITTAAGDAKDRAAGYVGKSREKVLSALDKGRDYVRTRKDLVTLPLEACVAAYGKERSRLAKIR